MSHFDKYRQGIVGIDTHFKSPYGKKKLIYADWTASGRRYHSIDSLLCNKISPYIGNTHTETSLTGSIMTKAYHRAKEIIKAHVNTTDQDIIISSNAGMTGVINKFQRILGLKIHEKFRKQLKIEEHERPIVFVSHMEHHSNQTSWYETICDVEVIPANEHGRIDIAALEILLKKYENRKVKIAAVTSCSNVTGIITPYHKIAKILHQVGGYCFVDFAASAPYIDIDMHPTDKTAYLDAIYFSPHKFLGGPGSTGILIFNQKLYTNKVPDNPGGGTVQWTNPWGEHAYIEEIEAREDGGTPAFMQTIRVALCIQLKDSMGVDAMMKKEHLLNEIIWEAFDKLNNVHVLADNIRERLGIYSFYIDGLHYNLAVKLLNDRYGVQVRGGCSCAGTYGHYLLAVSYENSNRITENITAGDLSEKPGWIRMSIHPTMTEEEVRFIMDAIKEVSIHYIEWSEDYVYNIHKNEYFYKAGDDFEEQMVAGWFGVL